jgi:uncharacterized protein involved in outer membrane biogenesis
MTRRGKTAAVVTAVPVAAAVLLAIFWNWDWFIPIVDSQASAALGHNVTIKHLHVALGRVTTVRAEQIVVANPPNFPTAAPLADIRQLTVSINLIDYIFHSRTVIPAIDLDHPVIDAVATPKKTTNYSFPATKPAAKPAPSPELGTLTIESGKVHFRDPALKADVHLLVHTAPAAGIVAKTGQTQQIAATATGTYNNQPITGTLSAGALLTIRSASEPYPIDLALANGATHVALAGTVQNPLHFAGANLHLTLAGADMANLYALTGIPIPATPQYRITGNLAYQPGDIAFTDFHGTVGNSDLEGSIHEKPGAVLSDGKSKPVVHMNLASKRVDLNDLGGFIGTKPGGAHEPGISASQRAAVAKSQAANPNLLPNKPFNLPKLNAANIYLIYKADSIVGKSMPLDRLAVNLSIVNGAISLHPVSFGVGTGKIAGNIALTPKPDKKIHAVANVDFDSVNIATLLAATHVFKGGGLLQGKFSLDATGNSIATWAGNGNGGLALYMTGGNLSDVLVSLAGLEFGNAVVAALGLPRQTDIKCFVGDFGLNHGLVTTKTLLLDTGSAVVRGKGTVNLTTEAIKYALASKPKHFSIGSLPTPIQIGGTMKKPSIGVAKGPLAVRGGAAIALGIIAAPLALIPTIQFGVKDPHVCEALVASAETQVRTGKPGQATSTVTPKASSTPHGATTAQLNREELTKPHRN